jgi:hypothetical protein
MTPARRAAGRFSWAFLNRHRHKFGFVGGVVFGVACALVPPHLAIPCQAVVQALSALAGAPQ